jgi:hypothetical protein
MITDIGIFILGIIIIISGSTVLARTLAASHTEVS